MIDLTTQKARDLGLDFRFMPPWTVVDDLTEFLLENLVVWAASFIRYITRQAGNRRIVLRFRVSKWNNPNASLNWHKVTKSFHPLRLQQLILLTP